MARTGVEVVVVGVESGLFQPVGLGTFQHAEGHAGLHARPLDRPDHPQDRLEVGAVFDFPPGRPHAKPLGPQRTRLCDGRLDPRQVHESVFVDVRFVVGRLGTVGAVLGAGTGLDRQKRTLLDVASMAFAEYPVGLFDEPRQRPLVGLSESLQGAPCRFKHSPYRGSRRRPFCKGQKAVDFEGDRAPLGSLGQTADRRPPGVSIAQWEPGGPFSCGKKTGTRGYRDALV